MRTLLLLPVCLLAGTAHAAVLQPAEGVWRFPASNGSGLTLDVRDSTIGIGLYTYDESGDSIWYSGAGQLIDGVVETNLAVYRETAPGVVEAVGSAKPARLLFDTATQGTMTFDGSEPLDIEQLAFGADYIPGWNPVGAGDAQLPSLLGRWLFVVRPVIGGGPSTAYDVEFVASTVSADGTVASFRSTDYPVEEAPASRRNYEMQCGPDTAAGSTTCLLSMIVTPPNAEVPAMPLGTFDPADLSPNRAVGTLAGGEVFGFRVPSDITAAPQPGIWQIRGRNGSGMTLDVRENGVAVGIFSYDEEGNAVWSLAQGPIVANTLTAPLVRFGGGSCLTCPQTDPVAQGTPRNLSLQFISGTRALLTLGTDAPIPLVLLPYGTDYVDLPVDSDPLEADFGAHALPRLAGGWVFSQADVDTGRRPDDAIALDFIGNTVAPAADPTHADLVGAQAAPLPRPEPDEDTSEMWLLDCSPTGESPNATCDLGYTIDDGSETPSDTPTIVSIAPVSELSGTRYLGTGTGESEIGVPVWGFRVPPRAQPAR